ncbi:MAG: anaerobic sulfatase maturase [Prevotellaceae bacterium]|nr:anaerobic sulfatase maturase [Prevotellaceae bacterium]
MTALSPFSFPLYVMLKPAGASCNLRCAYCYYLPTDRLYGEGSRLLSDETLELFTRQYIEAQTQEDVMFCWHGGEPLLRPLSFYRRALALQREYANGHRIVNCLQTNGTLISEDWARFLRDNHWLVGVSIDGPRQMHDELRRTRRGLPSWAKVRQGIRLLNKHNVEWNAMAVVNALNADRPEEFYLFFRDELKARFLQFAPILEPGLSVNVTAGQWGRFLCRLFDLWVRRDVGEVFVQMFDATLANWTGEMPGLCSLSPACGHCGVMEHNGDVYSCDHFVDEAHLLGNIRERPLTEMMYGQRQREFGKRKGEWLPVGCKQCRWLFACHGECPKNRDQEGRSLLCEGYKAFFSHSAPAMERMRDLLRQGLPPSDVMKTIP